MSFLAYSVGTHSIKPGSTETHPTWFSEFRDRTPKFQPCTESPSELGPGLHGRGKCAVGRTVVGTAGALPALHQDISAPGKGLGGDSNFGQVTTAPFFAGEDYQGWHCLSIFLPLSIDSASFGRFQIGEVAWCGGFNCCMLGQFEFYI